MCLKSPAVPGAQRDRDALPNAGNPTSIGHLKARLVTFLGGTLRVTNYHLRLIYLCVQYIVMITRWPELTLFKDISSGCYLNKKYIQTVFVKI